jgi:uroporphyrinogen decarboxylase
LGQDVDFIAGKGPQLSPIVTLDTKFAYQKGDLDRLEPVYQTLTSVADKLPSDKALIGFSGAPWTIATYMIEGQGSRDFSKVKSFAYSHQVEFENLINVLVMAISDHLIRQIQSGADIVQIFDSWSGVLPPKFFKRWVINPTKKIIDNVKEQYPNVPIIGFPKGAGLQLPEYVANTGVTAISFDYATNPKWIDDILPKNFPVQGNLDPSLLLCGGQIMLDEAEILMDIFKKRPHIFNLGHGIIKETPPSHVLELSQFIQKYRS